MGNEEHARIPVLPGPVVWPRGEHRDSPAAGPSSSQWGHYHRHVIKDEHCWWEMTGAWPACSEVAAVTLVAVNVPQKGLHRLWGEAGRGPLSNQGIKGRVLES